MSFSQETKNAINGWGQVLRFITPILITIGLWIMSDMKFEIREIRQAAKDLAVQTINYNINMEKAQKDFQIKVCERLTALETCSRNSDKN